jgi:hypothetical protein
MGFILGADENVLKLTVVIFALFYEYMKTVALYTLNE